MTGLPDAMLQEAKLLHRQNRVPEAIDAYRRILARWPMQADVWFNLAVLQRQMRDIPAALHSYDKALAAGVEHPEEVHLNRSVLFGDFLREPVAAERELHLALALNPSFVPALLNLGNLCEDLGRRTDAQAAYERILALEPRCFAALARLANLQPPATVDLELTARLQQALASRDVSAAEHAALGFALGRLLDAAGDYPAAFAAYTQANRSSRASATSMFVPYDRAVQESCVNSLIAARAPSQAARAQHSQAQGPRPIFVCGMFRSGSTLVEQLLASCAGVAAGGELDFLPRLVRRELAPFPDSLANLNAAQLTDIVTRYQTELARVSPNAIHVIDKRPDNFLYIGLIKALFPDARIINTVRHPLDNCLSIHFLHLDQHLSYALDLLDTGHYFREYRRLMTHWKSVFAGDIVDFDYDALVREPQATLQGLCSFLELDWSGAWPASATGAPIKTASVWQVREPLYQRSSGRWRHYAAELEPLRGYLADLLPT